MCGADLTVDRALCRLSPEPDFVTNIGGLYGQWKSIGCGDGQLELLASDDDLSARAVAECLLKVLLQKLETRNSEKVIC